MLAARQALPIVEPLTNQRGSHFRTPAIARQAAVTSQRLPFGRKICLLQSVPSPAFANDQSCRPSCLQSDIASCPESLEVFSPSKINLFLRVIRRRDDGFHDLASLFHVIDLGDFLTFTPRHGASEDVLACNMDGVPLDSTNLVIKALELFRRHTGSNVFFDIDLRKVVPHGAGLGGGSGNAATALWAANEMTGRPASNAQLLEWSAEIGSDISVFFSKGAAYCTGRGEVVENVDPSPLDLHLPLLLVKPDVSFSTPAIFKALDLDQRSTANPRQLLDRLAQEGLSSHVTVNDLEQPAFDILPELRALKDRLATERRFSSVFMTGSGSTIVCAGNDQAPELLTSEDQYADLFVRPARLIVRNGDGWYAAPGSTDVQRT